VGINHHSLADAADVISTHCSAGYLPYLGHGRHQNTHKQSYNRNYDQQLYQRKSFFRSGGSIGSLPADSHSFPSRIVPKNVKFTNYTLLDGICQINFGRFKRVLCLCRLNLAFCLKSNFYEVEKKFWD
jgi:hypothetical protein